MSENFVRFFSVKLSPIPIFFCFQLYFHSSRRREIGEPFSDRLFIKKMCMVPKFPVICLLNGCMRTEHVILTPVENRFLMPCSFFRKCLNILKTYCMRNFEYFTQKRIKQNGILFSFCSVWQGAVVQIVTYLFLGRFLSTIQGSEFSLTQITLP